MGKLHLPPNHSPGSLDPLRAPNGATPRASFLRRAADGMNTVATYHKKLLLARCQNIADLESGGAPTLFRNHFYFRTGENTVGVRVHLGVTDTDYGAAANPHCVARIYEAAGGTLVVAKTINYNGRKAIANPWEILNRTNVVRADLVGLDSNTEYFFELVVEDGARPVYMAAHEVAELHADDAVTGVVDPSKFLTDGPIYDEHVQDLLDAGDKHWRHGGCHYLSWGPDFGAVPLAWTATSFTNLMDGASTSRTAATPGVTLAAQYHGHAKTAAAGPGARMAVLAIRTAGSGSLDVRLTDGTATMAVTGITTGGVGDWYVANVNIPAAISKWDPQAKVTSGTFDIYAVSLFAYEAGP